MNAITKTISALLMLGLLAASLHGCSSTKCGANTIEQDGQCVPADYSVERCGAGTVRVDQRCVLESEAPVANNDGGECTPDCEGRECGSDGCGGLCGRCEEDDKPFCDNEAGACILPACEPFCEEGSACGDDGCGGSCGTCPSETPFCTPERTCAQACVPICDGKSCGDDGCGGSCGTCGDGTSCNTGGVCVPDTWMCAPIAYGDGFRCDCACGSVDPDCAIADPNLTIGNCQPFEVCNSQGACEASIPPEWTCAPDAYDNGAACDCSCGAPDPDCEDAQLPMTGCPINVLSCQPDGTCGACTPECTNNACGPDGCGGTCGSCDDPTAPFCDNNNQCVGLCDPVPLRCQTSECGSDGCGGSCGTCPDGQSCAGGQCIQEIPDDSCQGICGQTAASGCSCAEDCAMQGNCCADVDTFCGACTPDCAGKVCGDDGCGGSCGACNDPTFNTCSADQTSCVDPTCTPDCSLSECGDDGCGGTCGTCQGGLVCSEANGKCLPPGWICDPFSYGGGVNCDCGCGAADPDCAMATGPVIGCPGGTMCDPSTNTCQATLCSNDAECAINELCIGAYYANGRLFQGICSAALAMGQPAGATCAANTDCASEVCINNVCRSHCTMLADCLIGDCLAMELDQQFFANATDPALAPGRLPVCAEIADDLESICVANSDCARPGDRCAVFFEGISQSPTYYCAPVDAMAVNTPCGQSPVCPAGLVCAPQTSSGDRACVVPCPSGQADCGVGETCTMITVNDRGTPSDLADDVQVPGCVP